MMFSSKSRYALRVMLDLARQSADGYVPLNDIAMRQNISRKYLEAIMNALCKGRLVESTVGKSGGYRLLRPPAEYTAGEILRAAEGDAVAPVACLAANGKKCDGACDCGTICMCPSRATVKTSSTRPPTTARWTPAATFRAALR